MERHRRGWHTDLQSLQTFRRLAAEWWSEPVNYTGFVRYFATRSLAGAIRLMIGTGIGLISVISLAVLLPAAEQISPASHIVTVLFAGLNAVWATLWCVRPWPTRRQSRMFVIASDIGIAAVALIGSNWITGLFALNCFALVSVYLVFFDGPKSLTLHTILILLTTMIFIVLASTRSDIDSVVLAGRILGAVIAVTTTPLGIQFGIQTLRVDAIESTTDPLTGVLNRRGLHLHFADLLQLGDVLRDSVTVIVVDLDRFKDVNDAFGHAVGDQVLIRCARRVMAAVAGSALVARLGGEEFVIVDITSAGHHGQLAERIRQAIMAPSDPPAVTASLGVAIVQQAEFLAPGADWQQLLRSSIARADQAMFHAKHDGGNTIRFY